MGKTLKLYNKGTNPNPVNDPCCQVLPFYESKIIFWGIDQGLIGCLLRVPSRMESAGCTSGWRKLKTIG